MGTETWIISLPLSDSILYLKIIHPPNFREEPKKSRVVYCHPKEINNSGFLYRIYPISQKYMFCFTILSFNTMPHFIVFCVSSLALLHRSATKQYVRHNTNG